MNSPRRHGHPDRWSLHEFQEKELNAPANEKWELIDGVIWKMMTGGTLAHNEIVVNLTILIGTHIKAKGLPCRVYSENARLVSERDDLSVYPDVAVRCGPRTIDQKNLKDPILLIEVLSRSTVEKDRYDKADAYFRIPSVKNYLLVSQDRLDVTLLTRGDTDWVRMRVQGQEDVMVLELLGLALKLADIYEGIPEFGA